MKFTAIEYAVLSLLAHNDGEINTRTRLHQLVFLLDEEHVDDDSLYSYKKYDYGPHAPRLNHDIESLDDRGLVRIITKETFGGHTRYTYRLTATGHEVVEADRDKYETLDTLNTYAQRVADKYGDLPLSNLIELVSTEYPEYHENSVYLYL